MKRVGKALLMVVLLAVMACAFFAGSYISDQEHAENRAERCRRYLSFALDTVTDKGVTLEGASEAVASNIWVAHELCDDPELSAELSNMWNAVVYEDAPEDTLAAQLKDMMERCQ